MEEDWASSRERIDATLTVKRKSMKNKQNKNGSFLGVFALSKPGSSSRASSVVSLKTSKTRKRTTSDGSHSQASRDSFDAQSIIATKLRQENEIQHHLRLDDSLTKAKAASNKHSSSNLSACASIAHHPVASTSSISEPKLDTQTGLNAAYSASTTDRKGKRKERQTSLPVVVEVVLIPPSSSTSSLITRPQRATSLAPPNSAKIDTTSARTTSTATKRTSIPITSHATLDDFLQAHNVRPSGTQETLAPSQKRDQSSSSSAFLLTRQARRERRVNTSSLPKNALHTSTAANTVPPSTGDEELRALVVWRDRLQQSCDAATTAKAKGKQKDPDADVSRNEESQLPKVPRPSTVLPGPSQTTSFNTAARTRSEGNALPVLAEAEEAEEVSEVQEKESNTKRQDGDTPMLNDEDEEIVADRESSIELMEHPASASKKSVTFQVDHKQGNISSSPMRKMKNTSDAVSLSSPKAGPKNKPVVTSSSRKAAARSSSVIRIVSDSEDDYQPTEEEEEEEESAEEVQQEDSDEPEQEKARVQRQAQHSNTSTASKFGSSPLTPLQSSSTTSIQRATTSASTSPSVSASPPLVISASKAAITSQVRSSTKRRAPSSDFSDEDSDTPLRELKSPSRSASVIAADLPRVKRVLAPPAKSTKRLPAAPQAGRSAITRLPLGPSNKSSAAEKSNANAKKVLFTRSKASGATAECRQCHRCETYQAKNKTLRCMTCELAICNICLLAYYADIPSYAAVLAFIRLCESSSPIDAPANSSTSSAVEGTERRPLTRTVSKNSEVNKAQEIPEDGMDLSELDFRCPVCKFLCRCPQCLRGPFPKATPTALVGPDQASVEVVHHTSQSLQRRTSNVSLSSDNELEPLHWPRLARGTSTRPNLKVRLQIGRPTSALSSSSSARLSKSAQQQLQRASSASAISNGYFERQDAIAGEAARRAQIDAETEYVPVVASRTSRRNTNGGSEQSSDRLPPISSSESEDMDWVQVTSVRSATAFTGEPPAKSRTRTSDRVRLATKVGQQLGKSPAYVQSRRSPRREGDQLIPYNDREPVLTLGPEMEDQDSDIMTRYEDSAYAASGAASENAAVDIASTNIMPQVDDQLKDDSSNELMASLLVIPDTSDSIEEEEADIPSLEDLPPNEVDYMSTSDTVTTASASSIASPPATEEKTVRFELPHQSMDHTNNAFARSGDRLASIFLPGINEDDDFSFLATSPNSTPTTKSRFLQNPNSSSTDKVAFAGASLFESKFSTHKMQSDDTLDRYLYGSPSRHTAFDIDLMPDWSFDNLVQT